MSIFAKSKLKKNKCPICGLVHSELPDIGSDVPYYWNNEYDNKTDCFLTDDLCIIENRDYFFRGLIQIPILNTEEYFCWGVWISQKKENFEIYRNNSDSDKIGPYFGWLSTEIDFYKTTTVNLKTKAHFRGNGLRPKIEVGPVDHELYNNQENGISNDNAWDIIHYYIKQEK